MAGFRDDPRALTRSFIQSTERYSLDGVMVDVDTATLVGALGMPVEFPADEPAIGRVARLANLANVDTLPPPDIARYALATLVRGMEGWLTDIMDPELEPLAHRLLDYCRELQTHKDREFSASVRYVE